MSVPNPRSCDTFVVLPPCTGDNCVIFGKNSDRPCNEVQEVIFEPAADHPTPSKVKCTYIEIDQIPHTYAVVLSKPSWMWGAEMGANEHGLCIGNEAVWTKLNSSDDHVKRLLGMDLLRLGLERAATAEYAVRIIADLLETHGQGGNCSNTMADFTYHNSFLIADPTEAWILETAGRLWAAERITQGYRNISNELYIGSNITLMSSNLQEYAEEHKLWKPSDGKLSFKDVFGYGDEESGRYECGKNLLKQFSAEGKFKDTDMFKVLRDDEIGMCMAGGGFVTTGSQVSTLYKSSSGKASCHWFTGTPDPMLSLFKPFIFTDGIEFPLEIVSPGKGELKHILYKHQVKFLKTHDRKLKHDIKNMKNSFESDLVRQMTKVSEDLEKNSDVAQTIFKSSVEKEISFLE